LFLSRSVILRIRKVSDKLVENIKAHNLRPVNFSFFENCTIYGIMWKIIVEQGGPQTTIRCMSIACWVLKATNTHSDRVTRIAFPLLQRLHERASMFRESIFPALSYFGASNR